MQALSEKVYLQLDMPTDDDSRSDQIRIRQGLEALGYENVAFPLHVLAGLYPMCRDSGYQITVSLVRRELDWVVTQVEPGDTRQQHYGLAVDYGSTTIVMQLVDLRDGHILAEEKLPNRQIAYGTDILTRITYALESEQHKQDLREATTQTFDALLDALTSATGIDASRLPAMVVSGNTTMIHFLLKLDAWTVFASPYAPVCSDPGFLWGRELGVGFGGLVYIIPSASNYIGGDIVSGLLQLQLHKKEQTSLFFDIGTNGELVIGNKEWILAGAGAAGPALEGYISQFGMRAADGAIDHLKIIDNQVHYSTIGDLPPVGICGSGIIDLMAQMRLNGWIDIAGNLIPEASNKIILLEDSKEYGAVYAYTADGKPLYFSQTDIFQYVETKAAAYTMMECLLDTVGTKIEDIHRLYLSGAFPAHSDLESAITIGIFPDLPRETYICVPNTSLDGARILLTDRAKLAEAAFLSTHMHCIQFASVPDFLVRMQAAKFIPHTDMNRYPTVRQALKE